LTCAVVELLYLASKTPIATEEVTIIAFLIRRHNTISTHFLVTGLISKEISSIAEDALVSDGNAGIALTGGTARIGQRTGLALIGDNVQHHILGQ
jgi:hypothetical protein